jgi:hypothetical protein
MVNFVRTIVYLNIKRSGKQRTNVGQLTEFMPEESMILTLKITATT